MSARVATVSAAAASSAARHRALPLLLLAGLLILALGLGTAIGSSPFLRAGSSA